MKKTRLFTSDIKINKTLGFSRAKHWIPITQFNQIPKIENIEKQN